MSMDESKTYITPLREAFKKIVDEQKAAGETREVHHLLIVDVRVKGSTETSLFVGTDILCHGELINLVMVFSELLKDNKCPVCEGPSGDELCTKH